MKFTMKTENKDSELRQKDWDSFVEKMKRSPDKMVTRRELSKALDFISDDIGALAQMVMNISNNH